MPHEVDRSEPAGVTVVPYKTLDSVVGQRSVRLLKIDCDGCEPAAYKGASHADSRRPASTVWYAPRTAESP